MGDVMVAMMLRDGGPRGGPRWYSVMVALGHSVAA